MRSIIDLINKFVSTNGHIGIFISGGFDSCLLAELVFREITKLNLDTDITIYTVPRYDDSSVHADRICTWLRSRYPNISFNTKLVGDPNEHHSRQVLSGILESIKDPNVKILLGDTAISEEMLEAAAPVRIESNDPRIVQPMLGYDKTITISMANDLGLLNEISELTHTCTESPTLRCSICWQCRERAWAFAKLGLVDKGTM